MRAEFEQAGIPLDSKSNKKGAGSYSAYTENDQNSMIQSDRHSLTNTRGAMVEIDHASSLMQKSDRDTFNGLVYRDSEIDQRNYIYGRQSNQNDPPKGNQHDPSKEDSDPPVIYSRGIEASGGQAMRDPNLPLQRLDLADDLAEQELLMFTRPSK
jgi:hypothetical protein